MEADWQIWQWYLTKWCSPGHKVLTDAHILIIVVPGRCLAWMETGKLHCVIILGAVNMSAWVGWLE